MQLANHFGTLRQLYEKVGYHLETEDIFKGEQGARSLNLRRKVVRDIIKLFPDNVVATHLPKKTRSMLLVDGNFMVALSLCRSEQRGGERLHWLLKTTQSERNCVTLVCTMNSRHNRVLGHYVFPAMDWLKLRKRPVVTVWTVG